MGKEFLKKEGRSDDSFIDFSMVRCFPQAYKKKNDSGKVGILKDILAILLEVGITFE